MFTTHECYECQQPFLFAATDLLRLHVGMGRLEESPSLNCFTERAQHFLSAVHISYSQEAHTCESKWLHMVYCRLEGILSPSPNL